MSLLKVKCSFCHKKFLRTTGRINEAVKFGWKFYCSPNCQFKSRRKRKISVCANSKCNKRVSRLQNQFEKSKSKKVFCSTSCSAIYHNKLRIKYKKCSTCGKIFYGKQKYCSKVCYAKAPNPRKIPIKVYREKVISDIINFYNTNKRIPVKKEMYGLYVTARKLFGTWNKAIIASGFQPNPVMFSLKYIANDGHKCDSFAEKIIDDLLYSKNINHQRNFPYPKSKFTADFKVNDKIIEFFGLAGEVNGYDKNIITKKCLAKKYNFQLIEIYPKDLLPIKKLSKFLDINLEA
jgi:hypothetical protein